jgi:hypothetical protein
MNETLPQAIASDPITAAIDYYATCLESNPKAAAFVAKELGLTIDQAREQRIGFSDRSLGKQLPSNDTKTGKDLRQRLIEIGLYKTTGHEALRGCITIPVIDDSGNVTGIEGRRVDKKSKAAKAVHVGAQDVAPESGEPTALAAGVAEDSTTKDTKHTKKCDNVANVAKTFDQAEPKLSASSATTNAADNNFIVEDGGRALGT